MNIAIMLLKNIKKCCLGSSLNNYRYHAQRHLIIVNYRVVSVGQLSFDCRSYCGRSHRIQGDLQNFGFPYARPYAKPHTLKKESSAIAIGISLILDIHVMFNWKLSKQGMRWSASRDHIAGTDQEVKCLFEVDRWPDTWFSCGLRGQPRLILQRRLREYIN